MIDLLRLCGFEEYEFKTEIPRIEKAFGRLGITHEDIERGKQRLNKYYDMELSGVRRAIGLCVKEVVNTVLAREDGKTKIIYGLMAPGFEILGTAVRSKSDEIYITQITQCFQFVLGCVFGKIVPILEAAEGKWLKAGRVHHCGNLKTFVGLLSLGLIPKPDLLVTSGQLCDTAPKTIDLAQELYNIPTYSYDTCQDREFREYPDSSRVISLHAKSLRGLSRKMQEVVGFEITDDLVLEAMKARGKLGQAVRTLQTSLESNDPLIVSPTHEQIWYCMGTLSYSESGLEKPTAILNTMYQEILDNRIKSGKGILERGAPRILSICPSNASDPRQEHLLCELGIASVSSETGFCPIHGNRDIDFDEERPTDPYEMLSQGLQRSFTQVVSARVAIIIEVCKRLGVDGVLCRYHVACRNLVADTIILRNEIVKQLGIPVLLIEWESFDPRIYDEEQLRKRLQVFKEAMKERR